MSFTGGLYGSPKMIDLRDVLIVQADDGGRLEFEVVGLLQDDDGCVYAVAHCVGIREYLVTSAFGDALSDEALADRVLGEYFQLTSSPRR